MNNTMFRPKLLRPRRLYRRRRIGRGRIGKRFVMGVIRRSAETKQTIMTNYGSITLLGTGSTGNPPYSGMIALDSITPVIPVGTSKFNRIGNAIQYKFLTFRLNVSLTNLSTTTQVIEPVHFARIILFQKRLPLTTVADVLQTSVDNPTLADFATPVAVLYPAWNQNVRVLNDEVIPLSTNNYTNGTTNVARSSGNYNGMSFTWRHKVNNKVSFNNQLVNTPGDPKDTYGLLIMFKGSTMSADLQANTVTLTYSWAAKLSYTDV